MNAGIVQDKQHTEGGKDFIATDTGRTLNLEGGEFILPDEVSQDKNIYTLSGSNIDVIKQIFKIIGLQWDEKITHIKSVDNIICIRSAFDPTVYTYTGTLQQIISGIQSTNGCTPIEGGAVVKNEETGETGIAPAPIVFDFTIQKKDGGTGVRTKRFKNISKAYRNIDGINYQQWTDGVESKEHAQQIIDEEQKTFPNHTFIFRKMNDGYRVYRSTEKNTKSNTGEASDKLRDFKIGDIVIYESTSKAFSLSKGILVKILPDYAYGEGGDYYEITIGIAPAGKEFAKLGLEDETVKVKKDKVYSSKYEQELENLLEYKKKKAQELLASDIPNEKYSEAKRKITDLTIEDFKNSEKKDGGRAPRWQTGTNIKGWYVNDGTKTLVYKNGGKIAQGYVIAPYSKLKGIFGEPNVKNEKDKIGWFMAIDKNHTGAVWTEAPKSLRKIMKDKYHKWFVWGANDESTRRLYEALRLQVRDIDPVKQKEKEKAISMKRWVKKREHIRELSNNVHRLKLNLSKDLKSEDEKEFLTALLVLLMLTTAERVGNDDSADNGHFGCTGFQKQHLQVVGNKVHLNYTGKSGVKHEKSFSDERISKALKKAIKNSKSKFVFETSDGFRIKCDKVNRYLSSYKISAKDLRGYNANKWIIRKLEKAKLPEGIDEIKLQKERKKIFNAAIKKTSSEVGHGASTLKKHYMIPELYDDYVLHGRIIDMRKMGYFEEGGKPEQMDDVRGMMDDVNSQEISPSTLNPQPSAIYNTSSYFFNPVSIPEAVKLAGEKLDDISDKEGIDMQEVFRRYPVKEIAFKDIVPMQEELHADKLEQFINDASDENVVFPIPFSIEYEGKYYWNDGHHRAPAFYINGRPILTHVYDVEKMKEGGKGESPEAMAKKFMDSLSSADMEKLKQTFNEAKDKILVEEEKKLNDMQERKLSLENERKELWEKEMKLDYGAEKDASFKRRMDINKELERSIYPFLVNQQNIVKVIKNGGDLLSFTDKKGTEHKDLPDFRRIFSDLISFDEDSILTDAMPAYIPFIDEKIFARKGYIFDAIRIGADQYLVAVNGYEEQNINYGTSEERTDAMQGYIITTLDQLALINDYYFTKAKAEATKEAEEKNKRTEEYYDKLPRERREKHLSQKGFYRTLPAKVKKQITEEEYEKLSLEEKEKLYKPYKHYGAKRLTSKLDEHHMWVSYHNMYERFLNPEAIAPKKGYANQEVFDYWRAFRDMMSWKIKDIHEQREQESEVRKAALETSFGESNTNDSLKEQYGILVKRQNGTKIMPAEIEQIQKGWERLNTTFGNMVNNAREANLKISHTGLKYVFASKAAGMFVPKMMTIAVSNKFGDNQFEQIFAHETGHWIDKSIGKLKGKRYSTDDYESTAGKLAFAFRNNMNARSDSRYVNATVECFARAMEQYFAFENFGEDATLAYTSNSVLEEVKTYHAESRYVSKEKFNAIIKPLIKQFLSEQAEWFNYGIEPEKNIKMNNGGKERETIYLPPMVVIDMNNYGTDDIVELRKESVKYMKTLQGKQFSLEESNPDIKFIFLGTAIDHIERMAGIGKLKITKQLPEIFKQGIILKVEDERKGDKNTTDVLKCATYIMFEEKVYLFEFTLKRKTDEKFYLYEGRFDIRNPEINKTA